MPLRRPLANSTWAWSAPRTERCGAARWARSARWRFAAAAPDPPLLELHLGSGAGTRLGGEIRIIALESREARHNVIREHLDGGVVPLQRLIVFPALHRDAVLGPRKLIL